MAVTPDQVYGDSQWLRDNPALISKFSQLLTQYGIVPDADTLGRYGLSSLFDPSVSQAASANPYSTAALLKNHLSGQLTNNGTTANAHGALFSGAFQNMQDQAGRDYQQNYATAGAKELADLLGVQGQQQSLYDTIFQRQTDALTQAQPDPTPYAAPTFTPGAPTGVGQSQPTPQNPYVRTGPEAGGNVYKPPKKGFSGRAL